MWTVFLICAVVGGSVLLCQVVLSMVGLGGHEVDISHGDVTDIHLDVPGDHGLDVHGGTGVEEGHDAGGHHGSTWLFGVISLRTMVAACTFFGLTGLTSMSAELPMGTTLFIAISSGLIAMFVVHGVMRMFFKLSEDGTVRLTRAIGREGKVYIPVPAGNSGRGKVQLKVQDRLVEYAAFTRAEKSLGTGARVLVVAIHGGDTLEVRPLESEPVAS
ncbi:MAG: hypothetical protein U1A77_20355 [Pirellulales bacterium]